jgi:hypothetical protein
LRVVFQRDLPAPRVFVLLTMTRGRHFLNKYPCHNSPSVSFMKRICDDSGGWRSRPSPNAHEGALRTRRSDRPEPFSAIAPGLFKPVFWVPQDPSTLCRTWNTGLAVASDLWFWSACSGNASCPCAPALCGTEQLQEPCCAPVELGHRSINKRGPDVVDHGPSPSESRAFRLEHEIGASEKRLTIPEGNGARARVSFNGLRNYGQRVFSKERAT